MYNVTKVERDEDVTFVHFKDTHSHMLITPISSSVMICDKGGDQVREHRYVESIKEAKELIYASQSRN